MYYYIFIYYIIIYLEMLFFGKLIQQLNCISCWEETNHHPWVTT